MKTKRRKQPPMIYFSAEHYEMMRAENRPRVFVAVLNYRPAMQGAEHLCLHATGEMITCTHLEPLEKCERAIKAVEVRRIWTQESPMFGQDIEGS